MSRKAYPKEMVRRAHELRSTGMSYAKIAGALWTEFRVDVGHATVRDWVTYYSRGPA